MIAIESIRNNEVAAIARDAASFLSAQRWCGQIRSGSAHWAAAGVLGVFQFGIVPAEPGVDDTLWVIAGDVPPAYLVLDDSPTWRDALEGYVEEMERWVDAVRNGGDLREVIPVNVAPTTENATALASRLAFIRESILAVQGDLLGSDV